MDFFYFWGGKGWEREEKKTEERGRLGRVGRKKRERGEIGGKRRSEKTVRGVAERV